MKHKGILFWLLIFLVNLATSSCTKSNQTDSEVPVTVNPILSNLSPTSGYSGDVIRLIGRNFGEEIKNVKVYCDDQQVELTEFSSSELTIVAPDLLGKIEVQVEVAGKKSTGLYFQVHKKIE